MTESQPDPGVIVGDDGLARPARAAAGPLLRDYYDTEWGMPVTDEQGVYERISLEAGWALLGDHPRKRPAVRAAFDGFPRHCRRLHRSRYRAPSR